MRPTGVLDGVALDDAPVATIRALQLLSTSLRRPMLRSLFLPPTSPLLSAPPDAQPLRWVVCLCADWCGVCRDYRAVFEQVAYNAQAARTGTRFAWVDVEDQAEFVGDLDVETFPTLLIVDASGLRFMGPLTPQANVLQRMLDSIAGSSQSAAAVPGAAPWAQLISALPMHPEFWIHQA